MKVIKKENVENWSHRITCSACNSELEVEAKDLKHIRYDGDQREPGYDKFYANCAICSDQLTIPSNNVPKLLQIEARNRSARNTNCTYWDR